MTGVGKGVQGWEEGDQFEYAARIRRGERRPEARFSEL